MHYTEFTWDYQLKIKKLANKLISTARKEEYIKMNFIIETIDTDVINEVFMYLSEHTSDEIFGDILDNIKHNSNEQLIIT